MKEAMRYANTMFAVMLVAAAALTAAALALFPDARAAACGLGFGCVAGALKFRVLDVWAALRLQQRPGDAVKIQFQALVMGLGLLGAAFALAFLRKDLFLPLTTAVGFFVPRILLVVDLKLRPNPFEKEGDAGEAGEAGDPASPGAPEEGG
jgi:hypothetical protein